MLEMRAGLSIAGNHCPAIIHLAHFLHSHVDHGFDGQHHSISELHAMSATTVIGHFRWFMQFAAKSMTDQFPHYAIPVLFGMVLHRKTNITDPIPVHRLLDRFFKTFLRYTQQLLYFIAHFTNGERVCAVAIETVHEHAAVNTGNIAVFQRAITW